MELAHFSFLFFSVYLFLRQREGETETETEAERERKRNEIPSRLCIVSTQPDVGLELMNGEIMT